MQSIFCHIKVLTHTYIENNCWVHIHWHLPTNVPAAITSKSCFVCEQHERKTGLQHTAARATDKPLLFQGDLVSIYLTFAAGAKKTGVTHGGPAK